MTDFPKRPKMPRKYGHYCDQLEQWCREHVITEVTGGGTLQRFPAGTILNAGTGGAGGELVEYHVVHNGALYTREFLVGGDLTPV
jgi:hypothetical protein